MQTMNVDNNDMGNTSSADWWLLAALVAGGVALRMYFEHIPNFAPVAAIALFAGFVFRSRALAIAAPIAVMGITDWFLGGYHPALMITVYAMLTLPVLFRGPLRRTLGSRSAVTSTMGLMGCTLLASVLFFVVTNFATWMVSDIYAKTFADLGRCFMNAIPFFRYTLAGDMAFATALFGAYALVANSATNTAAANALPSADC